MKSYSMLKKNLKINLLDKFEFIIAYKPNNIQSKVLTMQSVFMQYISLMKKRLLLYTVNYALG